MNICNKRSGERHTLHIKRFLFIELTKTFLKSIQKLIAKIPFINIQGES